MSPEQITALVAGLIAMLGAVVTGYSKLSETRTARAKREREEELADRRDFVPRADVEAMQKRHDAQLAAMQERCDRQIEAVRADLRRREEEIAELRHLIGKIMERPAGSKDRRSDTHG